MLAALAIIGLTATSVAAAIHVVGALEAAAGQDVAAAHFQISAQRALSEAAPGQAPIFSDELPGLTGTPASFSYACSATANCGARLARGGRDIIVNTPSGEINVELRASRTPPRFVYASDEGPTPSWPQENGPRQRLRWIGLRAGDTDIAGVTLWPEEPRDCAFDSVSLVCRSSAP